MKLRCLLVLSICGALCASCGRPSPLASGTGYGVGVPRTAITLGTPPQARGERLWFKRPVEQPANYRAKHPPKGSERYRFGGPRQMGSAQ